MSPPALIKGCLLDLALLLRVSGGSLPLQRAATAAASTSFPSSFHPPTPEEELQRRIRHEMRMGGGGAGGAGGQELVGSVARTLGVAGFSEGGSRDPRNALSSAVQSAQTGARGGRGRDEAQSSSSTNLFGNHTAASSVYLPPALYRPPSSSSSSDVRAKYLARLQSKKSTGGGKESYTVQDEEDLGARQTAIRRLLEANERQGGGGDRGDRGGLLAPPVLNVLEYLAWRGLKLGLLSRGREGLTSELLLGGGGGGGGKKGVVSLPSFAAIAPPPPPPVEKGGEEEEKEEEEERREVRWLTEQLRLEPQRLLLVTGEPALVGVGKRHGCFTCLLVGKDGEEDGRGEEDYRVHAWEDVEGVVEDLNGVSFRTR